MATGAALAVEQRTQTVVGMKVFAEKFMSGAEIAQLQFGNACNRSAGLAYIRGLRRSFIRIEQQQRSNPAELAALCTNRAFVVTEDPGGNRARGR